MSAAVQNKHTLVSLLKANSQKLRSYGVSTISIFGSFITGKLNAESDVDLLVDFNPDQKSYDNFMDLSFFLEDLLGRKVEVVTPQSLSKYIGSHILEQAENVALIHNYFGVDYDIVWDIITSKLPDLEEEIQIIISENE